MKQTFKYFLENVATRSSTFKRRAHSSEDAFRFITEQCTEWVKFVKNNRVIPLFRGDTNSDDAISFGSSNNFYRYAANTESWYSKWIDSSPEWEGYPKRLQSYICSSDTDYASGYGDLCIVVPSDLCKIAACPDMDIFSSFTNTGAFLGPGDVATFQVAVRGLFDVMGKPRPPSETSGASLRKAFEEITTTALLARLKEMDSVVDLLIDKTEIPATFKGIFSTEDNPEIDDVSFRITLRLREISRDVQDEYFKRFSHGEFVHPLSDIFHAYSNCKSIVRAMINNNIRSLAEVYDRKFRPKENGFELINKLSAWRWKPDRELWVQGGCYFINLQAGADTFLNMFREKTGISIDSAGTVRITKDVS